MRKQSQNLNRFRMWLVDIGAVSYSNITRQNKSERLWMLPLEPQALLQVRTHQY